MILTSAQEQTLRDAVILGDMLEDDERFEVLALQLQDAASGILELVEKLQKSAELEPPF